MQVSIHEAKTQLSKLIAAVERGEEVVIARRDQPVVSLKIVSEFSGKTRIGSGIISMVRMLSDGLASPPYRHHDEARIWMYSPMVARRIAALISSR